MSALDNARDAVLQSDQSQRPGALLARGSEVACLRVAMRALIQHVEALGDAARERDRSERTMGRIMTDVLTVRHWRGAVVGVTQYVVGEASARVLAVRS